MPVLPPEADKNLCGRTDIGPSPPCRTGNFGARQQTHISGTIWPTEIVHISKSAEFRKELSWTVFKTLQNFLRYLKKIQNGCAQSLTCHVFFSKLSYTCSNTAPECIVQGVKLQNFLGEDPQAPWYKLFVLFFVNFTICR